MKGYLKIKNKQSYNSTYLHLYAGLAVIALTALSLIQLPLSYYFIPLVIDMSLVFMVLKTLPSVFDRPDSGQLMTADEKDQRSALWLTHLRWMFLASAYAFIFITIKILKFLPDNTLIPLLIIILVIALCNAVFRFLLLYKNYSNLTFQVYFDLLALTAILHFSGGLENPLSLLPVFHIIISGIILSKKHCFQVAIVANLFLGGLFLLEWSELIGHYTILIFPHGDHENFHVAHHTIYVFSRILLNLLVFFLIAFFTTILSEWAKRNEKEARNLANRIIKIQEDERSSIAKEIHESIGSSLYALKLLIHSTFSEQKSENIAMQKEYANLTTYLNSVMDDTRKISHSLSPVILERIGLFEALIELIKTFQRHQNLLISIDANDLKGLFNNEEKVHLYRIIQESLVNIIKHSYASKAKIVAKQKEHSLIVRIIDNGDGITSTKTKEESNKLSLGLTIMRERASLLSAKLTIKSKEKLGTVVEIEIPH